MAGDADELIARLAAEGEFEAAGGFSLDPKLALAKLREFQLRDPTRFVLHWIRAANLLGATRIDVEIDADDAWFRFDGADLEAGEFDALWSAVVGSTARDDARVRALGELALGINGAFAWSAKSVAVRSGALVVEFDREFAMTQTTLAEVPSSARNQIHAKRPLAWELLRRRALDARGELPEELLLATACARGRVPVILEGRRLNPPVPAPRDLRYRLRISEDEREGELWVRRPWQPSVLHVVKAGVSVATLELDFGRGFIEATIDDPRLPLDLAQEKIVEGPRYEALLDCVSRARWHAVFALLCLGQDEDDDTLRPIVRDDIFASPDLSWIEIPGAFDFATHGELPRGVSDPGGGFRLWVREPLEPPPPPRPVPAPAPLTLGELIRFARRRGTVYRRDRETGALPYVASLPVLRAEAGPQLRALGETVVSGRGRARYWEAVRALPPAQTWPLPDDWLQLERHGETLRVRVAWRRGATSPQAGALVLTRAGRWLGEYLLPPSWGPLWAEVDGPIAGHDTIDANGELVPGPALARAVLAVLEPHAELLASLATGPLTELERGLARAYLREAWGAWSGRRLGELVVIPERARRDALASWSGGWGIPAQWVQARPGERGLCDHELADLAWLDVGSGLASLRDVQRRIASHGRVEYVDRDDHRRPAPVEDAGIWRLDAADRALLGDLFPGCLEPFDLAPPCPRDFAIPESLAGARLVLAIDGPRGERGVLGLSDPPLPSTFGAPPRRGARVLLGRGGHGLGAMDVPLPVGSFHGVLEVPALSRAPHSNRALKDEAWRAAAELVQATARGLAEAQLEAWRAGRRWPDDARRVLDWTLDLERGGWRTFAAAWRDWQASLPPDHPLRARP